MRASPAADKIPLLPILKSSMLKGIGAGIVLGVGLGAALSLQKLQRARDTVIVARQALPLYVTNASQLSEPLVTLARDVPRFHRSSYTRLVTRINSMLHTAHRIQTATPASVDPSLAGIGSQMFDSVCAKLHSFYSACDVTVVKTRNEYLGLPSSSGGGDAIVGAVTLEPLNRDLRATHRDLVEVLFAIATTMTDTARSKMTAAVVDKYS
jgi:hypothetical protein